MSDEPALFALARREIVERHAFFVRWFTDQSLDPREFRHCEEAFHAKFAMVTPDGKLHGRAEVLQRLRNAKASMKLKFEIGVHAITTLWSREDALLIGYIEAQLIDGRRTERRSSALFESRPPNGVVWRHLHETWTQGAASSGPAAHEREEA
jgi:hypothetical protein